MFGLHHIWTATNDSKHYDSANNMMKIFTLLIFTSKILTLRVKTLKILTLILFWLNYTNRGLENIVLKYKFVKIALFLVSHGEGTRSCCLRFLALVTFPLHWLMINVFMGRPASLPGQLGIFKTIKIILGWFHYKNPILDIPLNVLQICQMCNSNFPVIGEIRHLQD